MNISLRHFRIAVFFIALFFSASAFAQNRGVVRDAIQKRGGCKSVAITQANGNVALFDKNDYVAVGVPRNLSKTLRALRGSGKVFLDVHLTEGGRWMVLCEDGEIKGEGIPDMLNEEIKKYKDAGEPILNVSFNDKGDWSVLTDAHISTSSTQLTEFATKDMSTSVSGFFMTDNCYVVLHKGDTYRVMGNIVPNLKKVLDKGVKNMRIVKIAPDGWYVGDGVSDYNYEM